MNMYHAYLVNNVPPTYYQKLSNANGYLPKVKQWELFKVGHSQREHTISVYV